MNFIENRNLQGIKSPHINQIDLISSGWPCRPVLLIALAAVNRPRSVRLEWDLGLLPALWTSYVRHLSWTAVKTASAATTTALVLSLEHLIHLPFVSIQRIEPATKNISTNLFESTQMQHVIGDISGWYTCWSKRLGNQSLQISHTARSVNTWMQQMFPWFSSIISQG